MLCMDLCRTLAQPTINRIEKQNRVELIAHFAIDFQQNLPKIIAEAIKCLMDFN